MPTRFITHLEADKVSLGLANDAPALASLGEVVLVADGFSSHVFTLGDSVILRVAKHQEAALQQVKEYQVLPELQEGLSLNIPQPEWYLEPSQVFPFGAIAYPMIRGRTFQLDLKHQADLEGIATALATFLLELHRLKPKALPGRQEAEEDFLWRTTRPLLRRHVGEARYAIAESWWAARVKRRGSSSQNINHLVHGDLWAENIILNDALNQIVGVIDFELLNFGDIAQDFAPQRYISKDFATMVTDKYQGFGGHLGKHFEQRVHDWSIFRELRGLRHAIAYPESNELEDSLQKLAQCW